MTSELSPALVADQRIIHRETLRGGQAWSRRMKRNEVLRIVDVAGSACVSALLYNAREPLERYNMADTLKAQFTAFLTSGRVLYSDMGRVLCSIIGDTCGWHDTISGCGDALSSVAQFGEGGYQELRNDFHRNARDNFLVELAKHGLGKRDIGANVNFFARVVADDQGNLAWKAGNTRPGDRTNSQAPEAPNPAAVVVLAAGEGRRMRSAAPKVLHEIAGRALLGHAVHAAAALAPEHLVVVAGHGRDQVREYLSELAVELSRSALLAIQHEQRGTGHAVACALDSLPAISGPVMVTYGDVPLLDSGTLRGLLTEHAAAGNAITVLTAELADPTGYGRVLRGTGELAGTVTGIVEQRDGTPEQLAIQEINSGVYVFEADVLRDGLAQLSPANAQGEQYLTDVVGLAHTAGRRVGALRCSDPWLVSGVNDRLQLAEGRYRLETAFGGRAFAADLWINTEATTAVVFAGAQALAVEQGTGELDGVEVVADVVAEAREVHGIALSDRVSVALAC